MQAELDDWHKITLPASTLAYYLLVKAYVQQGDLLKAKKVLENFQKACGLSQEPLVLSLLGHSMVAIGDHETAIIYYQQALELKPDYSVAQRNIESCLKRSSEPPKEIKNTQGVVCSIATHPNSLFATQVIAPSQAVNFNLQKQLIEPENTEQQTHSATHSLLVEEYKANSHVTFQTIDQVISNKEDNDDEEQLKEAIRLSLSLNQ